MTNAAAIAIAKAVATPPGSRKNASTAKKAAKLKSPSSRPRMTAIAAAAPCRRCANTHRTAAYTGKGDSRPDRREPSAGAAEVSASTNTVATSIRAGMSHHGSSTRSDRFAACRGITVSASTRAAAANTSVTAASPGATSSTRVASANATVAAATHQVQPKRSAIHA